MKEEEKNKYLLHQRVYIVKDDSGWNHGVGDGRGGKIMDKYPMPSFQTWEYEIMDDEGNFYHIPEFDLSDNPKTK